MWLGNTPVGIFKPDPANAANPPLIYYIHTDHLNTPRVVFDKANTLRWRWLAEPFGTTAPELNPSGTAAAFTQPLRFPGQYHDTESGLFYNTRRDYDASTGRYIESDPIGLEGGINTFSYVGSNPLSSVDPMGLYAGAWDDGGVSPAPGFWNPAPEANRNLALWLTRMFATKVDDQSGSSVNTEVCRSNGKDPCKGLRDQLLDHERKLREYIANPMAADNKGFLANAMAKGDKDLYTKIYLSRIASLQGQIANFKKLLEECERRNGL